MADIKNNKFLITITPVILYSYLVVVGILGVKFGRHWDEGIFMKTASQSFQSGVFIPHVYIYPSFCYYIVVISTAVYKTIFGISDLQSLFTNESFLHFIRCIFVCISSLIVFWVYIISLKITKNYWAALIAGLIICSSFEFSYHSRWAVSDCIVLQFTVLSALFLFLNINTRNKIIFSSLIAGLAAGTKYTGGIACLNILFFILCDVKFNRINFKAAIRYLLLLGVFFSIGFILTSPGVLIEFDKFIKDSTLVKNVYSNGHFGHTVKAGWTHFSMIFEYAALSLFSKNSEVSSLIFLFAVIGIISVLIRKEWLQFGLFVTLFVYIVYVSSFKVMIVRNVLYLLPFFAVFASIGFDYIAGNIRIYKFSNAFRIIILLVLFCSCYYVVKASLTIKNRNKNEMYQELKNYINENKDKEFVFSLKITSRLDLVTDSTVNKNSDNTYLVFYKDEVPFQFYTANVRNQFTKIIGIDDVNLDYYPTWSGIDRIIIMKYSKASDDILYFTVKRWDPDFRFYAEIIPE